MKKYDQAYYDRWYRSRRAVVSQKLREQKVRLAVAVAEFVLGRPIRSVLDIGCGEAAWRGVLRRLRPTLRYTGIDPSEYVVRRYGTRRNIRQGTFGEVGELRVGTAFDLIVCADVIMYVNDEDLQRGLRAVSQLVHGVAYIEAYTTSDDMIADFDGWHHRSEAFYRQAFRHAGLVACGLHCYVASRQQHLLAALERCG